MGAGAGGGGASGLSDLFGSTADGGGAGGADLNLPPVAPPAKRIKTHRLLPLAPEDQRVGLARRPS